MQGQLLTGIQGAQGEVGPQIPDRPEQPAGSRGSGQESNEGGGPPDASRGAAAELQDKDLKNPAVKRKRRLMSTLSIAVKGKKRKAGCDEYAILSLDSEPDM